MKKPRKLENAHLLTWEQDKVAKPCLPWQSWQLPVLDKCWLGWCSAKS